MRGLKDKMAIVTGGGGATCRRFAEEGAPVAVFDIDAQAAERIAAAFITGQVLSVSGGLTMAG